MDLEDKMLKLAALYRSHAKAFRDTQTFGKDADMDKHYNTTFANIWDKAAEGIEDEIRWYNRYHQEPT